LPARSLVGGTFGHFAKPLYQIQIAMKRRQFLYTTAAGAVLAALTRRSLAQSQGLPAVDARLANGGDTTLQGTALQDLRDSLHGRLLLPQDTGYEEARHIVIRRFDRHPACIVQAAGPADVRYAVDFARENRLLVAVKGGGHSELGVSTCDGGMMIDLSTMRGVRVDASAQRAWVLGGTLAGLIEHEALAEGLAIPLGDSNTVGIGGLATGGGFGRISRRFGLTLDAIRSVDVVTADGKLVHASDTENRDLFWAIRGGGGNFGVVTTFELQLYPMQSRVIGGNVVFPYSQARQVLSAYADYTAAAPDELYVDCLINIGNSVGESTLRLRVCNSGNEADADKVLQPIKRFGQVLTNDIARIGYLALQESDKQPAARGAVNTGRPATDAYEQAGFLAGIDQGLVAVMAGAEPSPGRNTSMLLQPAGGLIARVPNSSTAFNHRSATHDMIFVASWKVDENADKHWSYERQLWLNLKKYTHGFYNNDMAGGVTAAEVAANFGENYPRLARVKRSYDPGNLFRLNANIDPDSS
jgi:FAD/FMN-containing dehydrogenase